MHMVGFEPTRPCGQLILSQLRLPISPHVQLIIYKAYEPTTYLGLRDWLQSFL